MIPLPLHPVPADFATARAVQVCHSDTSSTFDFGITKSGVPATKIEALWSPCLNGKPDLRVSKKKQACMFVKRVYNQAGLDTYIGTVPFSFTTVELPHRRFVGMGLPDLMPTLCWPINQDT